MPKLRRIGLTCLIASTILIAASLAAQSVSAAKTTKIKKEIHWLSSVDAALTRAAKIGKPVMIDFMATWCPPCRAMEDSTFSNQLIAEKASSFVTVRIDIDKQREVAARYGALAKKYGGIGIPNILFLSPNGNRLKHIVGYYGPRELSAVMDSVLAMTAQAVIEKNKSNLRPTTSQEQ